MSLPCVSATSAGYNLRSSEPFTGADVPFCERLWRMSCALLEGWSPVLLPGVRCVQSLHAAHAGAYFDRPVNFALLQSWNVFTAQDGCCASISTRLRRKPSALCATATRTSKPSGVVSRPSASQKIRHLPLLPSFLCQTRNYSASDGDARTCLLHLCCELTGLFMTSCPL